MYAKARSTSEWSGSASSQGKRFMGMLQLGELGLLALGR